MRKSIIHIVLLLLAGSSFAAQNFESGGIARKWLDLITGWRFISQDVTNGVKSDTSGWQKVELPHTWNAVDGANGPAKGNQPSYRRGASWYALTFPCPNFQGGRRAFIYFGAASIVADVYLNGAHLGQHRGAFTAFAFEITSQLKVGGTNELRVRVDNSWVPDVPPLAGDFTMFGGIYRPVCLLVTSGACIDPLDHASCGVAIEQKDVTVARAEIQVAVSLSRSTAVAQPAKVVVTVRDAAGQSVVRSESPVTWNNNSGEVKIPLEINQPHLWQGLPDPYLYSVTAELVIGGMPVDEVTQPLGLRFYRVDPERGFYLNGKPYPLRGVARHQDHEGKGWAVSEADEREDMAIIRELGANAVRLAHYPQSQSFLDLCDRNGLLVWAEIPLVNKVRNTPEFWTNTVQQLTEMIRQRRNHPSIVIWGLFNELYHQGPTDPCEDLVSRLQIVAKREDPSRLTTAASNQLQKRKLNSISDLIACNIYPGWYGSGGPSEMGGQLRQWLQGTGNRGLGISEYGAGGSLNQHEEWPPRKPEAGGRWHPEEYQAFCHEQQYQQIIQNPAVWGSFVWNAFDFASSGRSEGDHDGINDKGLVSYDRHRRKDAFYFYKANWNATPMIHLNSANFDQRTTNCTMVRAYSNCDSVELLVNGKSAGTITPDKLKRASWFPVELRKGENLIQLVGRRGNLVVRDEGHWNFQPRLELSKPVRSLTETATRAGRDSAAR